MKGYIVSFDTLGRRFNDFKEDMDQYLEDSSDKGGAKFQGILTYGAFDRIMIEPVTVFSRFSNIPDSMTSWVGRHHSVFLYEIDSNLRVEPESYLLEEEKTSFRFSVKSQWDEDDFAYSAISLFSLSNGYSSRITDFDMALRQLRGLLLSKIDEIVGEYHTLFGKDMKIQCEVYGCFNTSEIAVLWVAEQYCDILQIIDQIKCLKIKLKNGDILPIFFNVYSIFSRYQLNKTYNEEVEKNGKGVALLQLVINNETNLLGKLKKNLKDYLEQTFRNVLGEDYNKCEIIYGAGEYDVTIRMPGKYAYNLFLTGGKNKNALFNRRNEFFDLIIKTRVYLGYTSEECDAELEKVLKSYSVNKLVLNDDCISKYFGDQNFQNIVNLQWELTRLDNNEANKIPDGRPLFEIYQKLREQVKKICPKTVGAVDTLDGLFTDYLSNIQACYNILWRNDFHYQFKKTIEYLLYLARGYQEHRWDAAGKNEKWSEIFWKLYSETINNLHQQIVHISQSNRMFLRIRASNLLYTGCYDFLLHAYYGIIKEILGYAYSLQSDFQVRITPLIAVNVVPHVESIRYTLVKEWLAEEDQDRTKMHDIIRFYIPYTLLTEPERGYYYIIHELFHYVAPPNRMQRNKIANELIIKEMLTLKYCDFICEKVVENILDEKGLSAAMKNRLYEALEINSISTGDSKEKVYDLSDNDIRRIRGGVARVLEQIKVVIRPVVCNIADKKNSLFSRVQKSILEKQKHKETVEFLRNIDLVKKIFQSVNRRDWEKERRKVHTEICSNVETLGQIKGVLNRGNKTGLYDDDKILLETVEQILYDKVLVMQERKKSFERVYFAQRNASENIIINGIKEAVPDFCMCQIGLMKPVDYVMHFVRNQIDLMKSEHDMHVLEDHDIIRLFSVIDYLIFTLIGQTDKNIYLKKAQGKDTEQDFLITYIKGDRFANQFVSLFLAEHASTVQMKMDSYVNTKHKAEQWLARIRIAAGRYVICYDCYRNTLLELFEHYDLSKRETTQKIGFASLIAACEQEKLQFGESIRTEENENVRQKKYAEFQKKYFDSVLAVAKHYMVQRTFFDVESCDGNKENKKIKKSAEMLTASKKSFETDIDEFGFREKADWEERLSRYVYAQPDFLRVVETYADQLYVDLEPSDRILWYRGQENSSYVLLPALLRGFNENCRDKYHNLGQMQRRNFEFFKVRLEGAPEMTYSSRYALADYIAFMQHYEKPTSFLDWSDNMMTALYFALEPLIDPKKEKSSQYASLYLFSPYKYNRARHYMLTSVSTLVDSGDRTEDFQRLRDHIASDSHVIPNLTVSYNEKVYDAYLLNTGKLKNKEMEGKMSAPDIYDIARVMPIAITTSRINPRINRQEGNFVAFHLDTFRNPGVEEEKDVKCTKAFDYVSLENIQKIFLKEYQKRQQLDDKELLNHAFLFKVDFALDTLGKELTKLLEAIGVQKGTIYPEPNNWRI